MADENQDVGFDDGFFDALAEIPNLRSSLEFADIEMKDGGNVFLFDGLATPYDKVTDFGGLADWTEEVRHGAFDEVLASGQNVPFLHEHRPQDLLATTRSGRLKLESEQRGLRARAKVVKTDLSSRIKALVDAGEITGMSTGWVVGKGNHQIERRSGGKPHRLITNFKRILDVSTTWDPAYASTEAQFRSMALQYVNDPDSWQRLLLGAYPQLMELGHEDDGKDGDEQEARSTEQATEHAPGATKSIAAMRRELEFLVLTTGGIDDEA